MIVPVAVVLDVAMPVVDVVHVAVVRHGDVPAARLVLVAVAVMRGVTARLAFVDVILMDLVQVTVMDVVDVVVVRHGDVPATGPMLVVVIGVLTMLSGNAHVCPRETCRPKAATNVM
ncbi:hypothetical protein SAMN05216276_108324 [Streptosporangium subroseum]|uniref:Uncharacterized protein n=1 Tax=Streptosporangium subroseum TaxID=106412 RepID=A0A239P417_9ACTN|nr:hypothetical protein SAMN05216276_108324 [Streptosporangium subroseum]